ncbi:methionine synthase [Ornithinimicrobium cavernae]|uniref:methionine synthase n=1 Tax=Ornithinimicrobium cavernae TaxID=2666047 RepID=UPI000D68644C|nr:methionine synthase [Ornithinimicrobium cavernae]
MVTATGIGSWPGTDVREALRAVRDVLTEAPDGVTTVPYLPELPARGPGADMVGRSAGLLVDLPVDLQPQGWRLVDRPGRDAERTASLWRQDLDELAEAYDGWVGPLKLQVTGPWTLAASIWLPLGDRLLSDAGATRDLADSLAEGVRAHVAEVARLVPGAALMLQVDEPSLPAVVKGHITSDSGFRVLPTPDASQAEHVLGTVLSAARDAGAATVVHCCADDPPIDLLRGAGPDTLALDLRTLSTSAWDAVAEAVEAGTTLWAGALSASRPTAYGTVRDRVAARWHELGLPPSTLADLGVTPTCGLAGSSPEGALELTRATVETARALAEEAVR